MVRINFYVLRAYVCAPVSYVYKRGQYYNPTNLVGLSIDTPTNLMGF